MPRKTDASNPADWLWLARSDLDVVRLASSQQVGFTACRSKLAEIVEKTMKAWLFLRITNSSSSPCDEVAGQDCSCASGS